MLQSEVGKPGFLGQVFQVIEDVRLDRGVERRDAFFGDQEQGVRRCLSEKGYVLDIIKNPRFT